MIKVLHVEDDPIDHSLFAYNLNVVAENIVLQSVESATEAISTLEKEEFDCIISDYQMPEMNGIELLIHIRNQRKGLPFIFLTGQGNEKTAAQAFRSGANDYYSKELGFAQYERIAASIRRNVESYKKDRKLTEAQEKLNKTRKRFENLFNQAPVSIMMIDKSGRLLDINENAMEMLSISKSEALEKINIFKSDSVKNAGLIPYFEKSLNGEKVNIPMQEFTFKNFSKQKYISTLNIMMFPLSDEKMDSGIVVIAKDITDLVKTQKEKMHSEARLKNLFDNAGEAIFISGEDGKIKQTNNQARKYTGYTEEELLEKSVMDIDAVHTSPEMFKEFASALNPGIPQTIESVHRRKDGSTYIAQITVNKVETPNGVEMLGLVRDITRDSRREEILTAHFDLFKKSSQMDVKTLLQEFLDYAEKFTESSIAFYHFVEEDQENLHLQTWSTNTLNNMCTAEGAGSHYPISAAGVWVDCVKTKEPVIHNDYESLTNKRGLPEGHAPIIRELVVPVIRGDKIVAILGVGNKKTEYDQFDVETVQQFADSVWEIVNRKRMEEKLKELL